MPKKVLEINDFTGGLNCYSDPRDIKDNEFAQNWNVNVSQSGITKLGGSLFESIRNLPHDSTNQQFGFGLFATGVDYSLSIIDGEFENAFEEGAVAGYAAGTPTITLAASSTHQSYTDHNTASFYKNYTILIYSTADGAAPQGETRRITAYAADTHVATLSSAFSAAPLTDGTEYYKIFRWVGDGTNFGNSDSIDYIDKGGADFPFNDIEPYNSDNNYFLRTEVSSIGDAASKPLGFITYNPSTSATFAANDTDSTVIGATTLKSGVEYVLSFYCKARARYYGYVSDSGDSYGERVPFIQLYSDSVTDGVSTGLYLFESISGPEFMDGADSTYDYADDVTKNYIDNGDFEDGGGASSTTAPTGFTNTGTANYLTYSYITGSNAFGADGATVNLLVNSTSFTFASSDTSAFVPTTYMYQDITLHDNQWYELFFAYSSSASGVIYSIQDVGGTDYYITDWTQLEHTGGDTTYKYIGQNSENNFPMPHKFFVKKSDTPGATRTIRVGFSAASPGVATNVRFDGITVRKSYPDLLSMSYNSSKFGNPYSSEMTQWNRYQMKFMIPSQFNNATDWVLNINAGTFGNQTGATGASAIQTIYFDSIRLEAAESDNLIFLNDNTSTESKIMIYSNNSGNWVENDLVWSGIKMQPVYDYINGILKISDANFESGNTSKIFYYYNKSRLGAQSKTSGYRTRDNALSSPPSLSISANGDSTVGEATFDALLYCNKYTFLNEVQGYGASPTALSNWQADELGGQDAAGDETSLGRVLSYYYTSNSVGSSVTLKDKSGSELARLPSVATGSADGWGDETNSTNTGDLASTAWPEILTNPGRGLLSETNPFYLAWAGNDGTAFDMASIMSSYTTGKVSKIEFGFTYDLRACKFFQDTDGQIYDGYHPYFVISAGKDGNGLFGGSAISSGNKTALLSGQRTQFSNVKEAVLESNGEVVDLKASVDAGHNWQQSTSWPYDLNNYGSNSWHKYGSKTFQGEISFTENDAIAITDDLLFKFQVFYPHKYQSSTPYDQGVHHHLAYHQDSSNADFPKYDRVIFNYIRVHFYGSSWTAADDGVTSADRYRTKVNFSFGAPTGATAVGWEERMYNISVSSVNIFDEESHLGIIDDLIGTTTAASVDAGTSAITSGQSPDITTYVGYDVAKDEYRKKLKYYMKDTESDIWYLQFYIDLEQNLAYSTTSNYSTGGIKDDTNECYIYTIPKERMLNYNEVDSYESQTLVPQDLPLSQLTCDYKASVVANNKLYVGNIRQDGKIYPDRMISSIVNKYNILPSSNFLDVAINDGDEITALEYYKDKILQFKKKKVFVINISGDYEFLEDTFEEVGVIGPYQVTKTPYGVVWINSKGCFIYDGETLTNLIDNKIPENSDSAFIGSNYWFISESPYLSGSVAYNASTKDIVIKAYLGSAASIGYSPSDTTGPSVPSTPDGYIYNIPTKSWYFTNKAFSPRWGSSKTGNSSNFTIDKDGNIITYVRDTETGSYGHRVNDILKWDSNKANDEAILTQRGVAATAGRRPHVFTTADYTFGDISVRKKIYKVYVSYKSMDSSGVAENSAVLVSFAINGSQSFTVFSDSSTNYAATTGLTGSTIWQIAELIPSSSINNIYSFQLKFEGNALTSSVDFKINDISIVYRTKPVK